MRNYRLMVEFIRKDRESRGGGLLVYIKSDIKFNLKTTFVPSNTSFNEILICEILNKNYTFFLVVFYRPPNADFNFIDNIGKTLENIASASHNCKVCDLNLPIIKWHNMSADTGHASNVCEIFNYQYLTQINRNPSRATNDNILDAVLTNFSQFFSDVKMIPPVFKSDHHMFEFEISLSPILKKR